MTAILAFEALWVTRAAIVLLVQRCGANGWRLGNLDDVRMRTPWALLYGDYATQVPRSL